MNRLPDTNPALKLDVLIWHPSYGGNGGISSEVPDIREWEVETVVKMKADPRIGKIYHKTIADTPITMVRNQAVMYARQMKCHLLLMIDSDQNPNLWRTHPNGKPFWDVAFDEVYNHYGKGPLVVGAPYCGPPPHENIYVFQWDNEMHLGDETPIRLDQYTRAEAAKMSGVQECGALPTGMILYDMRAFELIEPDKTGEPGWFYYEWTDHTASQKASTEDVTNTRNIAIAGALELGYNPLRCAWDCWIGHWKPWCVGKPRFSTTDEIAQSFKRTVLANRQLGDKKIEVDFTKGLDLSNVKKVNPNRNGNKEPLPEFPSMKEMGKQWLERNTYFEDKVSWPVYSYGHRTIDYHYDLLVDLLQEHKGRKNDTGILILEVGSWVGESTLAMALEMETWEDDSEIYCVDTFKGSKTDWTGALVADAGGKDAIVEIFKNNLGKYMETKVFPIGSTSANASLQWRANRNPKIDFLFIDADHSYEATKQDILRWGPLMADDGVMVGHDFETIQFPGVAQAVKEVFGREHVDARGVKDGQLWAVRMDQFEGGWNGIARPEGPAEDSEAAAEAPGD